MAESRMTILDAGKLRLPQRQRLTYIESVVYWEGRVSRTRVVSEFQVSENHVTKDFRLYKEAFPGNLEYDESTRGYRPSTKFRPRIARGSAEEYLALLRSTAEKRDGKLLPPSLSAVVVDAVPTHQGSIETSILNAVTRSISSGKGLAIAYQSTSRNEPAKRRVWPHALVFGGTRWHARAFDEEHERFIDLVLHRFFAAQAIAASSPRARDLDTEWNNKVNVEVIPRRSMSASQAEVVARQYGMTRSNKGWVWAVRIRECMVKDFIYLHRLDVENDPRRGIELRDGALIKKYLTPIGDKI
jgi:predicted DNA-binding transcriptional regulator YafY